MAPETPSLDFDHYHQVELPRLLAEGRGALAAADDLEAIGALAFRLPSGSAYTYRPIPGGVAVEPGEASARVVVELAPHLWADLVRDLESASGLLYSGRVTLRRGSGMRFVRWEPGLRALYHGRRVFDPDTVDLRDAAGSPLDPHQHFRLGDDRDAMAHFLRTAGFLLVKDVFRADEIAGMREAALSEERGARPGDQRSWWGKNAEGESLLCRVTRCDEVPAFRGLPTDPRIAGLAALSHLPMVPRAEQTEDGVSVLIKNPSMAEGLSDLPWHRDCGMGGHASMCPVLVFSIYLYPGRPETGELRVLPGSHVASLGFIDATDPRAPRGISLAADPGDVSLHYSDVMHAAPPPTGDGPFRKCVLVNYARPDAYNHRGDQSYNDVLLGRDDGQVEHLEKVAERA
ncbi:MAG: phytanoyl-CoA dioxygenase family protein [Myxococcota bacterium]